MSLFGIEKNGIMMYYEENYVYLIFETESIYGAIK